VNLYRFLIVVFMYLNILFYIALLCVVNLVIRGRWSRFIKRVSEIVNNHCFRM